MHLSTTRAAANFSFLVFKNRLLLQHYIIPWLIIDFTVLYWFIKAIEGMDEVRAQGSSFFTGNEVKASLNSKQKVMLTGEEITC